MTLRIENLPKLVNRALYREATEMYLDRSFKYIESLYGFGSVRYPGISDIDLLVVPQERFLAPLKLSLLDRLPPRFDCILEHNVFVVPQAHIAAFAFAHAQNLELLFGRPTLDERAKDSSLAGRLCCELERLWSASTFVQQIEGQRFINATSSIRVFSALRHTIRCMAELAIADEGSYGADIDDQLGQFLKTRSEQHVLNMFHIYKAAVTGCVARIAERLGIDATVAEQIKSLAWGIKSPLPGFRTEDVNRRNDTIANYHAALEKRNFYYGSMFISEFHPRVPPKSVLFRIVKKGIHAFSGCKRQCQRAKDTLWGQDGPEYPALDV